jgi:broad specificity phosphatase PhoE
MSANKIIMLIRHAESQANSGERNSSQSEIKLSIKGYEQAKELAKSFTVMPDLVITSPFIRTLQTAKPLLDKFPAVKHEQWPIHEFICINPKRCINTTWEERKPLEAEYWERCEPDYKDGEAESFSNFIRRVQNTIKTLNLKRKKHIIAFTHMYFILAVNWCKTTKMHDKIDKYYMQDFKTYLFANSIDNCQAMLL